MDKKDLISVRDYLPDDRNFILATWLRGLYYGDTWFSQINKAIFMDNYHRALEKFLANPNIVVKVACLKDETNVILGYSVSRNLQYGEGHIGVLDWIFVKSAWRGIGVGRLLLPKKVNACTHLTKVGLAIMRNKLPDCLFNPFLT